MIYQHLEFMPNQYNGLLVDEISTNSTENINRKLNKKLREIERLEARDHTLLNDYEKEKIANKERILELLNTNIYNTYSNPRKSKNTNMNKVFKRMEREQLEYKRAKEEKKKEKMKKHQEHWRAKYKHYEYDSYSRFKDKPKFDKYEKELIDACKVFQIKSDNINRKLVKSQYNKLALMNHPDKGGTNEAMIQISNSYGVLKAYLENNQIE